MKSLLKLAIAATALVSFGTVAQATELRLSHHWSNKDIWHHVAQIVADEVAAGSIATDGPLV